MDGFRARGAAIGIAALSLGCADLSNVTSGVCGDGVVDQKEDCDLKGANTTCGAPNTAHACQFICKFTGGQGCPEGYSCGTDDACRKPVPLTWEGGSAVTQSAFRQLLSADFDGDGVDDVLAVGASTVELHYFDSAPGRAGSSLDSVSILAYGARPAVGTLGVTPASGETFQPPSLALSLSLGLGVFTGSAYRTLYSQPYASVSIAGQWRAQPFLWSTTVGPVTSVATDFFAYNDKGVDLFIPPNAPTDFVDYGVGDARQGGGVVARFDKSQTCDQLALAFNNPLGSHIKIWSPCATPQLVSKIDLPGIVQARADRPLHLADVDFDGHPDLIISGADNRLYVAYSDGTGRFAAAPGGPPSTALQLGSALVMKTLDGKGDLPSALNPVLAVGDINGDCMLDFIDASGVFTSGGAPPAGGCTAGVVPAGPYYYGSYASPPAGRTWTEAQIADMNSDGLRDVVVGSANYPGVTLLRGTGTTLFNAYDFPTSAPTRAFAIGDFDGDLVPDLAYAEIGPPTGAMGAAGPITQDSVFISFGARSGPPSDPMLLANIDGVGEILPAKEIDIYGSLVDNAIAVADDVNGTNVYLFPGDTARQIESPYFILQSSSFDAPVRSVMGSFTGRTQADGSPLGDIAVFGRPVACGKSTAICSGSHLWLLPTKGDADLDPASALDAPDDLPGPFTSAPDALLGNLGPLAAGQHDSVVMATSLLGKQTSLAVATAAVDTADPKMRWRFPAAATSPDVDFDLSGTNDQLLTADIDGTGPLEVVLASASSGVGVFRWNGTALVAGPSMKYQEITGACGDTSAGPLAVAAFPRDATGKQALVAVTPSVVVLLTYDGQKLQATCLPDVSGGLAVAVGDFNGDALPDILVSAGQGLVLNAAVAYLPGGIDPAKGGSQ